MGLGNESLVKSNTSNARTTMAPALTEPIIVKQSQLPPLATTTVSSNIIDSKNSFFNRDSFQLAFEKHITSADGPKLPQQNDYSMDQNQDDNVNITTAITLSQNTTTPPKTTDDEIILFTASTNPIVTTPVRIATIAGNLFQTPSSHQRHSNNNNNNLTPTTMGLQKEREKENAEMEQMLGELTSAGDIDLLQVFKTLESAPSGEGLCDLAGTLSLFNDDVMNMCNVVDDVQTPVKPSDTIEIRSDIQKRQAQMQRKCDFLLRRLRKIQSRHMGQHVSEEIGNVYSDAYRLFKKRERDQYKMLTDESQSGSMGLTAIEKAKPISMSAMKTFMKKVNHVATTQSSTLSKQHQIHKLSNTGGIDVGSSNSASQNAPKVVSIIPEMDDKMAEKLENVSGMLQTELRLIETAIDSDATASSSGGESADENTSYNNPIQETLSM